MVLLEQELGILHARGDDRYQLGEFVGIFSDRTHLTKLKEFNFCLQADLMPVSHAGEETGAKCGEVRPWFPFSAALLIAPVEDPTSEEMLSRIDL